MSGELLLGGAAVAALVAWARSRAGKRTPDGRTPEQLRVDLALANLRPIGLSTAAVQRVQAETASKSVVGTVAGAALSVTSTILAAAGIGSLEAVQGALSAVLGTVGTAVTIIGVAVAILLVTMSIVNQLIDERLRIQTALANMGGSFYTVNTWEFNTCKAWLDAMKVPYTVKAVEDPRLDTTFYVDRQHFVRHNARYALVDVGMDPAAWRDFQLLLRCASLDYFNKIGRYLYYVGINLKVPAIEFGKESPPPPLPPAPPPPSAVWVKSGGFEAMWNELPLVGDATPNPLVPQGYGSGAIAPVNFATPNKFGSYDAILARFSGSQSWRRIILNNHFAAIIGAMSMYKLDPRSTSDSSLWWGEYAYHIWAGMGLRQEIDHVSVDREQGQLIFDGTYWGWQVYLDVKRFKLGLPGAVKIVQGGVLREVSFG